MSSTQTRVGLLNQNFYQADQVVSLSTLEEVLSNQTITYKCAALLMTHNYAEDSAALKTILTFPFGYIGILGPRTRTERLLTEVDNQSHQDIRIHGPAGLDIGTESPEEIAMAIVAQIQAFLMHRSAGFLRDRKGPIHERV